MADSWANQNATHGIFLINGKVPHGPVMVCHVAPLYWLLVCYVKFYWSLWGSTLGPPHRCKVLAMATLPVRHTLFPINYMVSKLYKFDLCVCRRRVGPGLSLGPWFFHITYAHTPVNGTQSYVLIGARSHGFIHMTTTGSARVCTNG